MQARRSPLTVVDGIGGWMLGRRRPWLFAWAGAAYTMLAAVTNAGIIFVVAGAVATLLVTIGWVCDRRWST